MTAGIARAEDIDWRRVHARLAHAKQQTREATRPSAERAEQILDARARRLARPLAAVQRAGAALDVLAFSLAGGRYAIGTRYVCEVVRFGDTTPLPGAGTAMAGVFNLRGQILPAFDMRRLFALVPRPPGQDAQIVVCGDGEADLGMVVDTVSAVTSMHADDLTTGDHDPVTRGIARDATVLIDGAALLADARLRVGPAQ